MDMVIFCFSLHMLYAVISDDFCNGSQDSDEHDTFDRHAVVAPASASKLTMAMCCSETDL